MALALPKAFWPVTITAGLNDKIDVQRTSDLALFVAAISPGTYYSAASLVRAVRDALTAAWDNAWGVEAVGSNLLDWNPSFETDTSGWGQYSGADAITGWGRVVAWVTDPCPHGSAFFRMSWAVPNTNGKGIYTGWSVALPGGLRAGAGWRRTDWFHVTFWARAGGSNVGQGMAVVFNASPNTIQAVLNPPLSNSWQQYDFRLQWAANPLPIGGQTGELYISIASASGTFGNLDIDALRAYSETTQPAGHVLIGGQNAFSLLFAGGANAAVSARDVLGFGTADLASGGSVSVISTWQHQNGWYAEDPVQDDTGELPVFSRAQTVALSGKVKGLAYPTRVQRTLDLALLSEYKALLSAEGTGHVNESLERLLRSGWARLRWWPDSTVEGTYGDYVLDAAKLKEMPRKRLAPGVPRYSLQVPLLGYV